MQETIKKIMYVTAILGVLWVVIKYPRSILLGIIALNLVSSK